MELTGYSFLDIFAPYPAAGSARSRSTSPRRGRFVRTVVRTPPLHTDGLPYVGRTRRGPNLVVAAGHAMMGVSLWLITGGSSFRDRLWGRRRRRDRGDLRPSGSDEEASVSRGVSCRLERAHLRAVRAPHVAKGFHPSGVVALPEDDVLALVEVAPVGPDQRVASRLPRRRGPVPVDLDVVELDPSHGHRENPFPHVPGSPSCRRRACSGGRPGRPRCRAGRAR